MVYLCLDNNIENFTVIFVDIYSEILEVVEGMIPQDIQSYIDTSKLPKSKKAKSKGTK